MLYSEFIEGTGCKANDKNYKVYRDLEILYMNSDLTKEEIYEYGKKLVDNSLTEEQVEWNKKIDEDIIWWKARVAEYKANIERYQANLELWKSWGEDTGMWKRFIKEDRATLRQAREKISELKACKYV